MTRRIEKSAGRKLNVRWSTTEWAPTIRFVEEQRLGTRADRDLLAEIRVRKPAIRKRRQVLWVRDTGQIAAIRLTGPNGSRTTWR